MNTNQTLKCQWVDLADKILKMKSILDKSQKSTHLTAKEITAWGMDIKITHKELTKLADNTLKTVISTSKKELNTIPLCPHCKAEMIQSNKGTKPPICENPTCPTNEYTPA